MIFNKLRKSKNEDQVEQETFSHEQIQIRFEKQIRKEKRKGKIKVCLFFLLILFCVVGAINSFAGNTQDNQSAIEAQTFIKTYAKNYFAFPAEEDYLKKFTISNWKLSFPSDTEYATLSDTEIYLVKTLKNDIERYYCYGNLKTKQKEQEAMTTQTYFYIDVLKKDNKYLVVRPIMNVSSQIKSITDDDLKKKYEYQPEKGTEQLNENEKSSLKTTLDLFIKTYNDDVTQARLLCTKKSIIDKLDPNIKLELTSLGSSSKDENNIYISCEVTETHKSGYSIKKHYHFSIMKEKNKINNLEVY